MCEGEKCLRTTNETNTEKCIHDWHRKLAHRNLKDIRCMMRQGLKVKACECSDICGACIKGNISRLEFPKKATRFWIASRV